ncbi:MAG: hypothetical protein OXI16_07730 [Chloroflexota bacterium]|nr:hypothetical protein [Chloroflexota bacterium]
MLVNFYIDPDAVDNNTNRYHIDALRSKWQQFGVLTHPSQEDGGFRDIRRRFPELNQSIQRIWARVWREIENDPTRYLRCRDDFSLALVSEARAQSRRISNGDSIYLDSDSLGIVEWIRLTEVNASKEFGQSEDLSRKRIDVDDVIVDLWRERFQRLARHARKVVIVDEWAVRADNIEGLIQFLNLLEEDANGCDVTIYSSPETELQDEVNAISSRLGGWTPHLNTYGVNSIEVRLRPEDDFRLYAHERHIRFDNRVVSIGRGMRTFRYATVREATDTSLTLLPPNVREGKENDLDEKAYGLSDFCLLVHVPELT